MAEGMDDLIRLAARFAEPRVTPHPDQRRRWGEVQRILEEIKGHDSGPAYIPPTAEAPTEVIEIRSKPWWKLWGS